MSGNEAEKVTPREVKIDRRVRCRASEGSLHRERRTNGGIVGRDVISVGERSGRRRLRVLVSLRHSPGGRRHTGHRLNSRCRLAHRDRKRRRVRTREREGINCAALRRTGLDRDEGTGPAVGGTRRPRRPVAANSRISPRTRRTNSAANSTQCVSACWHPDPTLTRSVTRAGQARSESHGRRSRSRGDKGSVRADRRGPRHARPHPRRRPERPTSRPSTRRSCTHRASAGLSANSTCARDAQPPAGTSSALVGTASDREWTVPQRHMGHGPSRGRHAVMTPS